MTVFMVSADGKEGKSCACAVQLFQLMSDKCTTGKRLCISLFSFSCLLRKPSVCEFFLRLFLIIGTFTKLCARHQKMKFISSAFQDGILRAEDPFVSSLFISSRRHCVRSGRHLIVIWWCALINKKQSFWSKTASCCFSPPLSLSLTERWNFSQFADWKATICLCVFMERGHFTVSRDPPTYQDTNTSKQSSVLVNRLYFIYISRSSVPRALFNTTAFLWNIPL